MADTPLEILKSASGDKRGWRRFTIDLTILVEPLIEDEQEKSAKSQQKTAVVTEISVNGLLFVSQMEYAKDSLVDIQLTLGTQKHSLRGLVVRSDVKDLPGGRTGYNCAVQFVRTENVNIAIAAIAHYIMRKAASGSAVEIPV